MATILLIEDGPGIGRQLPGLLAAAGHRVLRCGGGPTPLAACPLLRYGGCLLADAAELLVFACPLDLPLRGRSYRGSHLLGVYRTHPDYERRPLVLVAIAPPEDLEGTGPTELVPTFTDPAAVLAAVNRLLHPQPPAIPCPPDWPSDRKSAGQRRERLAGQWASAEPGRVARQHGDLAGRSQAAGSPMKP